MHRILYRAVTAARDVMTDVSEHGGRLAIDVLRYIYRTTLFLWSFSLFYKIVVSSVNVHSVEAYIPSSISDN